MTNNAAVNIKYSTIGYKKKALVIGISEYKYKLQSLDFCEKDGEDMYEILQSIGFEIEGNYKLIGFVKHGQIRDAIISFFTDPTTTADDVLLFYYSGHGINDADGDVYLASSEIDPDIPFKRGVSFGELTKFVNHSNSTRIVTILDCCYSGAAKLSKGHENDAAKLGMSIISDKSKTLQQGEGKCLLAASQATQEAFALSEGDNSIFTHFLLEGLKGNEKSVDTEGNVTPDTLGKFIHRSIVSLPVDKKPAQTPIRKVEAGGDIILVNYEHLSKSILDSNLEESVPPSLTKTYKKDYQTTGSKNTVNILTKNIKSILKDKTKRRLLYMTLTIIILIAAAMLIKLPLIRIYNYSHGMTTDLLIYTNNVIISSKLSQNTLLYNVFMPLLYS
jgi:uncharacterized caspase-like protein